MFPYIVKRYGVGDARDDEQGQVGQRVAVLLELAEGVGERGVLALAFVLPAEAALVPNVGEPPLTPRARRGGARDGDALLEGEGVPDGVELGGGLDAQELAEVEEVLLRGGPL